MSLWEWVFVDGVVGYFEHEVIYGSKNKDTLVGYLQEDTCVFMSCCFVAPWVEMTERREAPFVI